MGNDQQPEVVDKSLDVAPQQGLELNQSKFDAMIRFAEQADKIGRTLDTIRKFVLNRALPGDWVRHGDNINLSGPGAERVLSALGLMNIEASFTSWKYWKDTGTDKHGDWFVWWYEADVQIGGLRYEKVQGRAGSRDQFFGYAHGAWKDLSDVKETDIRMAARRGVIKDGIKLALGLRSIPAESAEALGIDPKKIKSVEYKSAGAGKAAGPAPEKAGTLLGIKSVGQRNTKKDGSGKTVYIIEDEKGVKYDTFSETLAKLAKSLMEAKKKAIYDWEPNGDYAPKLLSMVEAGGAPAPEPA